MATISHRVTANVHLDLVVAAHLVERALHAIACCGDLGGQALNHLAGRRSWLNPPRPTRPGETP